MKKGIQGIMFFNPKDLENDKNTIKWFERNFPSWFFIEFNILIWALVLLALYK